MKNDSRTVKIVRNVKVAILCYFSNLILQFFYRKILLDYWGSEILGLNTTIQNLLGFLNLAELGIGSAVAYNLYKPLFDRNTDSINAIVAIQGWLYHRVAWIVIVGALVLMCFFPWIFAKTEISLWYAYGFFIALLCSSLLGYFVNYNQIVLSADQKEYKITLILQCVKILKSIFQIFAICFSNYGYIWWIIWEIVMACIASLLLARTVKTEYPWLKPNVSDGKKMYLLYPDIITKTKQIFFHKIGRFVLTQTSPLIIYAYTSLTLVAVYGNYMLIITGLTALVNALLNSVGAGVGNLVAEGNRKKIKSVFWELTALRMWIASIVCFGLYMLSDSFIMLWLGKEYVFSESTLIVLIGITFINLTRTNDVFLNAYGLFSDVWSPVVEAVFNLGLSVLLGYYYGITGILSGVLISLILVVCTWKPFFLYSRGFKENILEYVYYYCKYVVILIITCFLIKKVTDVLGILNIESYLHWSVYALIVIMLYAFTSIVFLFCTDVASQSFVKRLFKIAIHK